MVIIAYFSGLGCPVAVVGLWVGSGLVWFCGVSWGCVLWCRLSGLLFVRVWGGFSGLLLGGMVLVGFGWCVVALPRLVDVCDWNFLWLV